jgi:hypothetical protein
MFTAFSSREFLFFFVFLEAEYYVNALLLSSSDEVLGHAVFVVHNPFPCDFLM